MKTKILLTVALLGALFISGCSNTQTKIQVSKPSTKVQKLINKYNLEIVDYTYAKDAVAKGTRGSSKAIFIDARPNAMYKKGTIPSSLNIPDTKFEQYFAQIKDLDKNKELIVFCGGWKCGKSPKVAGLLQKKGFKNVKLYQAGMPQWSKKNYKEVDLVVVKASQAKNTAFIIDARPYKMFLKETIPSSISIPDTKLDDLKGRFPTNKDEKIIVYCGGYKCGKSHKVAKKLVSLGYKNVLVFAAGIPAWKKASLSTTLGGAKVVSTNTPKAEKFSPNGIKLGSDEGTVDGEWFNNLIKTNNIPNNIQIIDVKAPEEFKDGHLKGSVNIHAEEFNAKEFYDLLPKDKSVIFNCSAGGRSLEAWMKLNDAKYDVKEIFYFDANIDCKNTSCKIEVNEPLD